MTAGAARHPPGSVRGAPERLLGGRSSWNPALGCGLLSVSFPLGSSLALKGGPGEGNAGGAVPATVPPRLVSLPVSLTHREPSR